MQNGYTIIAVIAIVVCAITMKEKHGVGRHTFFAWRILFLEVSGAPDWRNEASRGFYIALAVASPKGTTRADLRESSRKKCSQQRYSEATEARDRELTPPLIYSTNHSSHFQLSRWRAHVSTHLAVVSPREDKIAASSAATKSKACPLP
ncbi:hypothetical protein DMENIID0001_035350 [Sergentomyia squamirostris]